MPITTIDLTRELKELYAAGRVPKLVEVPESSFLMVDGRGDPNVSPAFAQAVEVLFSMSYTLKFALKRGQQLDYRVLPLEGLWWVPDMSRFSVERKADWNWTMMIKQPDAVDQDVFEEALRAVSAKTNLPALPLLRFERFAEELAAQVMHLGPYAAEGPTIQRLHTFIAEQGYRRTGKHHEIYLRDPRRSAPERLKTILRRPVVPDR